jgi:hypothetical protein
VWQKIRWAGKLCPPGETTQRVSSLIFGSEANLRTGVPAGPAALTAFVVFST